MEHKHKSFEFIPYEYGIKVMTLTRDSFSYPDKTWVGTIDDKNKHVRFCHGYFPKHPIGLKLKKYALKIGYTTEV